MLDVGEIGPARGGRKGREAPELLIEIVRGLTSEDLGKLQSPDSLGTSPIPIQALRASHHNLAQVLARGTPDSEAALITGYSPTRISILKKDPSFAELMASYKTIREHVFVDTLERMKILGLSTLDELQERLETTPERWTNRELMEMAELLLVKPMAAKAVAMNPNAGTSAPGVNIQVQFVKSETPQLTIEGRAEAIPSGTISYATGDRG